MADEESQSFENHARFVPGYHVGVFGVLALNLFWAFYGIYRFRNADAFVSMLLALALLGLCWYARVFALTVQDRVIRLEMRLRLREVLPASLHSRIGELSHRQLVALRFASDAELPDLAKEVLAGNVRGSNEIKQRIKSWQPDHLRA